MDIDNFSSGIEEYTYEQIKKMDYHEFARQYNTIPYKSNVAILTTSHWEHLVFMKYTLESFRKSGKFVICAYDNPFNPLFKYPRRNTVLLPTPDIWLLPHAWVFKHITYAQPKRFGWFWSTKYAFSIIDGFEFDYVFMNNSDCIWERPEGVDELIDILGGGDYMSSASKIDTAPHTCSVIFKTDALRKIVSYMTELMKVPTSKGYSPEVMLFDATKKLGLKQVYAPKQPLHENHNVDYYHSLKQDCTWKEILGFRNLGAERVNWYKYDYGDRPPYEYTDMRFATENEKRYYRGLKSS